MLLIRKEKKKVEKQVDEFPWGQIEVPEDIQGLTAELS